MAPSSGGTSLPPLPIMILIPLLIRDGGHCRRRRKMPPWTGCPSMVRALPENRRYVCIACSVGDFVNLPDRETLDSAAKELVRSPKCAVVIIDSYSLTIVQTVFHGTLSIGPLKSMAIASAVGDMATQSVIMVDVSGKIQYLPIVKDSDSNPRNVSGRYSDASQLGIIDFSDGSKEKGSLVAFANQGQFLALLYNTCCIFSLVDDGTTVGEIYCSDGPTGLEGAPDVAGGIFLGENDSSIQTDIFRPSNKSEEKFIIWNARGSAFIYRISYTSSEFKYELLFSIPAVFHPPGVELSISFIQFNGCLLRIESICPRVEEPSFSKPRITVWSISQQLDHHGEILQECKMLGEGGLFGNWIVNNYIKECEALQHNGGTKENCSDNKLNALQDFDTCSNKLDKMHPDYHKYGPGETEYLVSSSMVISEDSSVPLAVVYGFYNGNIEVLRFGMFFEQLDFHFQCPHDESNSPGSSISLSGHKGAVLCLASHRLMNMSSKHGFSRVLLSGSMDCTVRVWDLDSGNPIVVMHQHVAPVRQIVLPPLLTDHPWNNCFLSVGEDLCVALASLDTLRVERMFPGHVYYPAKVLWDSTRGYVACLCPNPLGAPEASNVLYIWDVKTGARERILRGAAAHSMYDHFCVGIGKHFPSGSMMHRNTSASSLVLPLMEESKVAESDRKGSAYGVSSANNSSTTVSIEHNASSHVGKIASAALTSIRSSFHLDKLPVKTYCPFPGIATFTFDITALMSLCQNQFFKDYDSSQDVKQVKEVNKQSNKDGVNKGENPHLNEHGSKMPSPGCVRLDSQSDQSPDDVSRENDFVVSFELCLLQFSLAFLHLWNVDDELDNFLVTEMKLQRPENFLVASGILGDRGSLTLTFPGSCASLELWKSSSEYCALRSLTMVSLAQHMIGLSHSFSSASRALSAFYMRNFVERIPDIKPPSLQLLVSFWQDELEHIRMAARSLFHCAASRAIPLPLCSGNSKGHTYFLGHANQITESENENSIANGKDPDRKLETQRDSQTDESEILSWLESFEVQDWISCVEGSSQDAMTSHIIVAAALVVWYPSLVKPNLASLVVHPLMKLVMAMNVKYSSTAAEILAEGMDSTWKECIGSEIPRLIGDIFFQIECVSGTLSSKSAQHPATSVKIQECLIEEVLPSLAMADITGFLNVIESQIWSTASDSPVHVVSLMTLIRVARGTPRNLAQYLEKVVTFILQTMDPANSVMRRTCLQSSMAALKEVVRIYPMVALKDTSNRLAVGDAIGEIHAALIRVYDMQSMSKIKVLDASGPAGLPSLMGGSTETAVTTAISALCFSPDGEGLVAFSENGLMIRWWSLGSVWWEKLSRNLVPVQCTKLIFVPPWEGFSPNSYRSSIMAKVMSNDGQAKSEESPKSLSDGDRLKVLVHNLDLSYRLEWVGERTVKLTQHGRELGAFPL